MASLAVWFNRWEASLLTYLLTTTYLLRWAASSPNVVELFDSTVANCSATVTECEVQEGSTSSIGCPTNQTAYAGGIFAADETALTIRRSSITNCRAGMPAPLAVVEVSFVLAGDVATFATQNAALLETMQASFAQLTGARASDVTVSVASASVRITVTINLRSQSSVNGAGRDILSQTSSAASAARFLQVSEADLESMPATVITVSATGMTTSATSDIPGTPPPDSDAQPDSGTPPPDSDAQPGSGTPPPDSGAQPGSGTPSSDSGTPPDSGTPSSDAGTLPSGGSPGGTPPSGHPPGGNPDGRRLWSQSLVNSPRGSRSTYTSSQRQRDGRRRLKSPPSDPSSVAITLTGYSGALALVGVSQAVLDTVSLADNSADHGGGMWVTNSTFSMASTTFTRNTARIAGGAIIYESRPDFLTTSTASDTSLFDNHVDNDGSGALIESFAPIDWSCQPGAWMETVGSTKQNFETCAQICEAGYYHVGTDTALYCDVCPTDATSNAGAASISECVCESGFFDWNLELDLSNGPLCAACPLGANCDVAGSTVRTLRLLAGYYRQSTNTTDVRQCLDHHSNETTGCVGGVWTDPADQCADGLAGVFCLLCANGTSAYYVEATDDQQAQCMDCGSSLPVTIGILLAALLAAAGAAALIPQLYTKVASPPARAYLAEIWELWNLSTKGKLIIGFYMIATKVGPVYNVVMPLPLVALFETLSVAISLGFLQLSSTPLVCAGLGGQRSRLIFWFLFPLSICSLIFLFYLGRQIVGKSRVSFSQIFYNALPAMLRVLFLVYPIVNTVAFQSFPFYSLGCTVDYDTNGLSNCSEFYLKVDVTVETSDDEYASICSWAWASIVVYPIWLPVMNSIFLFVSRKSISGELPHTPLSRAITFLYKDFHSRAFWWEIMEMLRRFFLVGIFGIVWPDTIPQLIIATLYSIIYLILQMQVQPYKTPADNFLAAVSSGAILTLFFIASASKAASLLDIEMVFEFLSPTLREVYTIPEVTVTFITFIAAVLVFVLMAAIVVQQTHADTARRAKETRALRARRLQYVKTLADAVPPRIKPNEYHLFLSHVWGTGQDQMRIVKTRMLEMMPDSQVFLDVDDLEDISDLEGYIDRTHLVLIYCSQGYFQSKNCMREIRSSVRKGKRLLPIIDPEKPKGGLTREEIEQQLIEADASYAKWGFDDDGPRGKELYTKLFAEEPIEWNRLGVFQDVSMRLVAERMLPQDHGEVSVMNEVAQEMGKFSIPTPRNGRRYHLYISPFNLGGAAFVDEVNKRLSSNIRYTTDVGELHVAERMLCYLTSQTWRGGDRSDRFADEVRMAMMVDGHTNASAAALPILLAHEMPGAGGQDARHGCDFGTFFGHPDGSTPGKLLQVYACVCEQTAWRN